MPSAPAKRRVTPSASKAASRKRCSSRTVTPHRAAWRRRISSNRSRRTWNVCGVGVSTATWKSAYCSVPPSGATEAGAPLPDESGRRDRLVRAERPEDLVAPRELRFADVEAGEPLSLQQDDAPPAPRQRGGRAGAARPPAHDSHIEIPSVARHADRVQRGWRKRKGLAGRRSALIENDIRPHDAASLRQLTSPPWRGAWRRWI